MAMQQHAATMVSEDVLDEVWLMMHMAAEMGTHHVTKTPAGYGEAKFLYEAEVEDDFLEEVSKHNPADPSDNGEDKEKALITVAERLMEMGDDLNKSRNKTNDVEKLSKEIADYIKEVMAPNLDKHLATKLSRSTATNVFTQSGVLSLVYQVFKERVGNFVGAGQDLAHIALVTHITRGVAQGLQQSTSGVAGLLATVATQFVQEKYGNILQEYKEKGGLACVVVPTTPDSEQTDPLAKSSPV